MRALIAIISAMIFRNMILVLALISSIVRGNMPLSSYTMLFGFLLPLVLGFLLFRLTVSKNGEKMANNMNNLGLYHP